MMNLRMISAQPATNYYAWQVEVYLNNFIDLGYNGNNIDVLASYENSIPESWLKLQQAFPFVRFFFYRNEIPGCNYPPAIQPHILKKHFKAHEYLKDEAIFYHDCDFVFTRYFDFEPYLHDQNWYFSNTDGYIGADYIEKKGNHKTKKKDNGDPINILDDMAKVVGICPCTIRAKRGKSGGAQKLMKGIDYDFWNEVEIDSIMLYNWLLQEKDNYGESESNDIQVWTASMWAELWNGWKRKKNIMIPKDFNFCWATDHEAKWLDNAFYHNAGVVSNMGNMFYKAEFVHKLPYGVDLDLDPIYCSKKYYDLVQEVGEKSVLI